jgi:hypothetical protein
MWDPNPSEAAFLHMPSELSLFVNVETLDIY